jgi:glycosyltransferase involved in cell wall biosynthesis
MNTGLRTLCFIADASSPHTVKWLEGCRSLNRRLVVISHWPGEIPGVEVIVHPLPFMGFWRYAWPVRRIIQRLNPDIVHAHQFGAHALYAWFSGCKRIVVSAWGSDVLIRPQQSRLYRWLLRWLIPKVSLITVVSNQLNKELMDLGARPDQILNFPMGIPRAEYEKLQAADLVRKPWVICSPRLHEPLYNLNIILGAFARIAADFPDVELWLLGNGSLTGDLQRYAVEHHLPRVTFWGRLSPADALNKIARSAVMVSIPGSDGTPVSMLEGMAAGCLLVVSDLPVYHDWIEDGKNGLIVAAHVDDLAMALRRSIEDQDLRERAARINRELIKQRAIWEDQFEKMLEYYRN